MASPSWAETRATAASTASASIAPTLTRVARLCRSRSLIVFAEPPTEFWAGGDEVSGDWRPTLLAVVTLGLFGLIVALPVSRVFFDLAPLGLLDYLAIGAVAAGWGFLVRFLWRARLFDRFLGIDFGA